MKIRTMLFAALMAAASVTAFANTPIGTLTGEPTEETAQTTQRVSSLNSGMEGMVEANAVVQMAYDYNRPVAPASDEVEVIKTRQLIINGKRVLVRPDGTLATKYAPASHRPTRRTVRRSSNGSSLALKRAIAKTNTAIKSFDKRIKTVETGFDAVANTALEAREMAQKALDNSKNALTGVKRIDATNGRTGWVAITAIIVAAIALIVGILAFFRRTEEIEVSDGTEDNTATDEDVRRSLNEETTSNDTTTTTTTTT